MIKALVIFFITASVGGSIYILNNAEMISDTPSASPVVYVESSPQLPKPQPTISEQKQEVTQKQTVNCQILNDWYTFDSAQACQYWQQYWLDKQANANTSHNSSYESNNYNLDLKPIPINNIRPDLDVPDFSMDNSDSLQPIPDTPLASPCTTQFDRYGHIVSGC